MGDLTPFVSQESETVKAIYAWHKAQGDAEEQRGYLGASVIGHACDRYLWYLFRGVVREEIEGRIYRLFRTGDLAEGRFVRELRGIGCKVVDTDEQGEQIEVSDLGGHFSGHMDAAVLGVPEAPKAWHVGEFKTHNAKSFAKLLKEGVKASKPMHWAQMQAYMGGTGMKRALYLAANKDTDELYSERVRFDAEVHKALLERAARVIRAVSPPERVAQRQDDFRCKWCSGYTLCWGVDQDGVVPDAAVPVPGVTCRTCCHSTPETEQAGAVWSCAKFGVELETTDVGAECPAHLTLPGLVGFAEASDTGDDWIEFTSHDGTVWRHGAGQEAWSSAELVAGRGPLEGPRRLPVAGEVPALLTVDFDDLPLVARYPWEDSEKLWDGPSHELADAMADHGLDPEVLLGIEPTESQQDEAVNAVAYRVDGADYLIADYKQAEQAAIWRGKA